MKTFAEFLKVTLRGGFLVLLPLFCCVFLIVRVVEFLLDFIKPLLAFLPDFRLASMAAIDVAAVVVLLLLCFLTGLFVKTSGGRALGRWVESRILYHMPGYHLFQSLSHIMSGKEETSGAPVVVRQGVNRRIGFLVEEHSGGDYTVFFPDAPTLLTGNVVIVRAECVKKLNVSKSRVIRSMASFGLGMNALLSGEEMSADVVATQPNGFADKAPRE